MQSKAWITLLQWKSWKNPLQLMPSDPAASVCLNMWSAGRGTLNGENPRATQHLEILLQGWVEAGWICMRDACMTLLCNKNLALATVQGFGKVSWISRGFPTLAIGLSHHTLHCVWLLCPILWCFSNKNFYFQSKDGEEGENKQTKNTTKKKKGKRLHSVHVRVLVKTH